MKQFDLTKEDFVLALKSVGYYVNNSSADLLYASLFTEPCGGAILTGPPGVGKSAFPLSLAKVLGCKIETFQVFSGMPDETLLVRHTVGEDGKVKASEGPLVRAAELSNEGPTILLINEIDKARPSLDALFLDFLQDGYVNYLDRRVYADFSNLLVYITSNDNRPLEQALLRRLPLIKLPPMSPDLLAELLQRDGFVQEEVGLAVKLYLAGFQAKLERPISYQELKQLLKVLRLLPSANLVDLVRTYLVKNEEELQKYLDAVKSLPEMLTWKEQSFSDEDLALKKSLTSSMQVEVIGEQESGFAIIHPKSVQVIKREGYQVKVRSSGLEQLEVRGGYFLMNDFSLHILNKIGASFVALEVGGENYLVLRKPLDLETATKLVMALQLLDKPEMVVGEFLCKQDFGISWEEFTSMFDLDKYFSLFSRSFRPYLLYKSGSGVRLSFKNDKDVELAELLVYNKNGRAHVEVHVKAPNSKEVQNRWDTISLYSHYADLKRRASQAVQSQTKPNEAQKETKQKIVQEEEDRIVLEDEKGLKLDLRKERINGENYLVVSTKNYTRALLGSDYRKVYHDVVVYSSVSKGGDTVFLKIEIYYPYQLERGISNLLEDLYKNFKEKTKNTPFSKMTDDNWYHAEEGEVIPDYDEDDDPYRLCFSFKYKLDVDLSSSELESKLNEIIEFHLRTVIDELVKPYLEDLKERERVASAIENVNQEKEENFLRRLR